MKRPLIVLALLGEMLLSGSTQAYDVMVVKSEYQAHDKSGGGCFYGYGVDKLEYQVEVGAFDALMFKKTDAFVVDLTEYLKENIFEDRCGPTIGEITSSLYSQNPQLMEKQLNEITFLTYRTQRTVGKGLDCIF